MLPALTIFCALLGVCLCTTCGTNGQIYYVNNTADALALTKCGTLNGDILIEPSARGDIAFDGIQHISGALEAFSASQITGVHSDSLQSLGTVLRFVDLSETSHLAFPKLESIDGSLILSNMPSLTYVDLSQLQRVGPQLTLYGLPALEILEFAPEFQGGALAVLIGKTNSPALGLAFPGSYGGIRIAQNSQMDNITLDLTKIYWPNMPVKGSKDIDGYLVIQDNAPKVIINLPNLESVAGLFQVENCSDLSIPLLKFVNSSMCVLGATLSTISAPNLAIVGGDLNLTGEFRSLSFPALHRIDGNLFIRSSNKLDCSQFENLFANGNVGGTFLCGSATVSTGLSAGAKAGVVAAVVFCVLILVALTSFTVIRRRRNSYTLRRFAKKSKRSEEIEHLCSQELWPISHQNRAEQTNKLPDVYEKSVNDSREHPELSAMPKAKIRSAS